MSDATRRAYTHYLAGDGIEIGALHHPLDVSGLPITRVRYIDRLPIEGLRDHYPELAAEPLVPVDIVDDGRTLATIPDNSLDFIVANHLIEHTDDPIGALGYWMMKLRAGGVVYLAVPDRTNPFDARRSVTTLAHLLDDYTADDAIRTARNVAHYHESVEGVLGKPDAAEATGLITRDYSIHFHVFTFDSFRALLVHARDALAMPLEIVDFAMPTNEDAEFLYILRKSALAELERSYTDLRAWAKDLERDAGKVRGRTRLQRACGKLLGM